MKEREFEEVASIIKIARSNTIKNINRALIELYWNIGGYIQEKITSSQWGQSVVEELGQYLNNRHPDLKGFSGSNLWRMRQFYSTYRSDEILAPLVREIGWSQNLSIMSRCKTEEERAFYLIISIENQYSKRKLDRQISTGLFERVMIGGLKLSPTIKATHPDAEKTFKDSYIFDFLNLSETYRESDLQRGLIAQMKDFILELGKDFLFFGEEYKLRVGNSDFYVDLLFYTVVYNVWSRLN